jgi:hypothetical protein
MFARVRTIENLKSYFEKFVSEQEALLAKMDKAREDGHLRHFLSSNAAYLHVLTVYAHESERYLKFIAEEREAEGGDLMTDGAKMDIAREEAQRRVINLNMRLTSRSTSPSANQDEDAERAFWIELYQALNGGY